MELVRGTVRTQVRPAALTVLEAYHRLSATGNVA